MKKFTFFATVLVLISAFSGAVMMRTLAAENPNALTISPVRRDLTVAPGKSGQFTLKVSNPTASKQVFKVEINDFVAHSESGVPALVLDGGDSFSSKRGLKNFVSPIDDVEVGPSSEKDIRVKINVPDDTAAGGYYGAIRLIPKNDVGKSTVNLDASAASIILLAVPGDMREEVRLTNFILEQGGDQKGQIIFGDESLNLVLKFDNSGDIHAAPVGQVYIKKDKNIIRTIKFNQRTPYDVILAGSDRLWKLDLGEFDSFGHYEIGLVASYGSGNQTIEASFKFWHIPWVYIIALAVLFFLIIIVIVTKSLRRPQGRLPRKQGNLRY